MKRIVIRHGEIVANGGEQQLDEAEINACGLYLLVMGVTKREVYGYR